MMEVPVLIVGAGPIGLAMGLVLDRFGIKNLILERSPSTTDHPKAHGCSIRTMEMFRVWGLDEPIRAGGLRPERSQLWFCESVTGRVFGVPRVSESYFVSPVGNCTVTQDVVENVLDEAVRSNQLTTLRRRCEVVDVDPDEDGVTATAHDLETGDTFQVRADYVIACDGVASGIRSALDIPLEGQGEVARTCSYQYRAETKHLPQVHQCFGFSVWPDDPTVPPGWVMFAGNTGDRWIYTTPLASDAADDSTSLLDEDHLIHVLRAHWGIPDLEIELINMKTWRASALLPETFRRDRVILAGDACHLIPASGGLGMNSGFQDVQNLGWKLALVLQGRAPDRLLDTYESERRPVLQAIIDWSVANSDRMRESAQAMARRHDDPEAMFKVVANFEAIADAEAQVLGLTYEKGALIPDGTTPPPFRADYYWPTDRPGSRFPHVWMDASWTESTIDWFDTRFVLVCGPNADEWRRAGEQIAGLSAVPLAVRSLVTMASPCTIEPDGAVLVRPDGFVAWRPAGAEVRGDREAALHDAMSRIVAGGTEAGR